MSKSTKSAGKTAVAHARAWVDATHPGSFVLEASKKVGRFPGGKDSSGDTIWINRTVEEDIFGVFDLAVFPPPDLGVGVDLIQVTTISRDLSAVRARQAKVGNWVRNAFPTHGPGWLHHIYVVGWVPRKELRIWLWSFTRMDAATYGGWREQTPHPARLPKQARKCSAKLGSASSETLPPF